MKRMNGESSAPPGAGSPNQRPVGLYSNKNNKTASASTSKHNSKQVASSLFISPSPSLSTMSNNNNNKNLSNISDLKKMACSRFADLKANLIDRSHSEILKDLEASRSRLHKRFKIQTQTCQQMIDEAEKEYKKMSERISESEEAMKASYAEFMADVQVTVSTVCKTSIPELSRSFEKAISGFQCRYGIQST